MSFGLNQVVGNYECLGIIDKPRAGITYKVRNLTTGEFEALRALPGPVARDPESAERLLREIRIQTRLTHPNVIGFHDAFELEGQIVMTTDYVDGPTLAQRCSAGPLPPEQAVAIVSQVLLGLEEAHAFGIVHRGITAEHVILRQDGMVKLGGFDLAKPASDTHLTKVGAVIGDPRYISPEQVIGVAELDARSDLYSVGVLLYLAVSGKMPFEGRNDFEVMSAQVSAVPERPSTVNPSVSAELERVVLKALEKKPDARFPDATEFRNALVAIGKPVQPPAAPTQAATPPVQKKEAVPAQTTAQESGRRIFTAPVICGICFVVISLAIGVWMALR